MFNSEIKMPHNGSNANMCVCVCNHIHVRYICFNANHWTVALFTDPLLCYNNRIHKYNHMCTSCIHIITPSVALGPTIRNGPSPLPRTETAQFKVPSEVIPSRAQQNTYVVYILQGFPYFWRVFVYVLGTRWCSVFKLCATSRRVAEFDSRWCLWNFLMT
jgi:hypothetical protein